MFVMVDPKKVFLNNLRLVGSFNWASTSIADMFLAIKIKNIPSGDLRLRINKFFWRHLGVRLGLRKGEEKIIDGAVEIVLEDINFEEYFESDAEAATFMAILALGIGNHIIDAVADGYRNIGDIIQKLRNLIRSIIDRLKKIPDLGLRAHACLYTAWHLMELEEALDMCSFQIGDDVLNFVRNSISEIFDMIYEVISIIIENDLPLDPFFIALVNFVWLEKRASYYSARYLRFYDAGNSLVDHSLLLAKLEKFRDPYARVAITSEALLHEYYLNQYSVDELFLATRRSKEILDVVLRRGASDCEIAVIIAYLIRFKDILFEYHPKYKLMRHSIATDNAFVIDGVLLILDLLKEVVVAEEDPYIIANTLVHLSSILRTNRSSMPSRVLSMIIEKAENLVAKLLSRNRPEYNVIGYYLDFVVANIKNKYVDIGTCVRWIVDFLNDTHRKFVYPEVPVFIARVVIHEIMDIMPTKVIKRFMGVLADLIANNIDFENIEIERLDYCTIRLASELRRIPNLNNRIIEDLAGLIVDILISRMFKNTDEDTLSMARRMLIGIAVSNDPLGRKIINKLSDRFENNDLQVFIEEVKREIEKVNKRLVPGGS